MTTITKSSQDLLPAYDPDKFVIGYKKGALDSANKLLLESGKTFAFNGSAQDFILLPKPSAKEQS